MTGTVPPLDDSRRDTLLGGVARPAAHTSAQAPRAARIVLGLLEHIGYGELHAKLPDGSARRFGTGSPQVSVRIDSWDVFASTLARGDVGFAEAWIAGQWHTEDLAGLLSLLLANREQVDRAIYGGWFGRLVGHLRHLLNRNSRAGSRRNIHAHYDLGNDFYRLWLDPSMTYSSGLFRDGQTAADPDARLLDAQQAKYDRILDQLSLESGASVLEIGCGWGGFAERAVGKGLRVTGLTLSSEQLGYARERLARAPDGLRPEIALRDYRDEQGRYDGIASIEMFEAVGEAYWPAYFATLERCLRPGGRAVVQTITIDDALFDRYRRGTDFIQQYVFPGGMLPSPSRFEALARRHGLAVIDRFGFAADYARTLAMWRERFMARLDAVRAQGFDERFIRTWEFYLAYCEAGFTQRSTDVIQFTMEKTG